MYERLIMSDLDRDFGEVREVIMQQQHDFTECKSVQMFEGSFRTLHVELRCPVCGFTSTFPVGSYSYFACDGVTIRCGERHL
jgi:hypothetical protein